MGRADGRSRRLSANARWALFMAAAGLLIGVAVFLGLIWLTPKPEVPGGVDLAEHPADATSTVSLAGTFPANNKSLANPRGIVWDGKRLFVTEADGGRIAVFTSNGARVGTIPIPAAPGAVASYPVDLALVAPASLAVVDTAGERVVVVSRNPASSRPVRVLDLGEGARPTAIAASDKTYYIADVARRDVAVFEGGRVARRLKPKLKPVLGTISGMAVEGKTLWVSDSRGGRVVGLDVSTGRPKAAVDATFQLPRAVVPGSGLLFVADVFSGSVSVVERTQVIALIGGARAEEPGVLTSSLSRPQGLAWLSSEKRLYVTDAGDGKVKVFNVVSR